MSAIADVVVERLVQRGTASVIPFPEAVRPASTNELAGVRLVFVNRYYAPDLSATSQILTDLTRALVLQGAEVHVVCCGQLYDDASAVLPKQELIHGVRVHRITTTRFGRDQLTGRAVDYLSFYASAATKLMTLVRRGDVLIAKTDPPMISVVAGMVARLRGAQLVNWLQDLFPEVATHLGQKLPGIMEKAMLWLRNRSLKMASANVVIGTRMQERLLASGVDPASIYVIENWSDQVSPMPTSASATRLSLGLKDKFVVGYSGNLGRAHEYETLLCAARALHHENDVVFLMVGGGAGMQELKKAVAREQLKNFIFLPYQPRELLADSLAAADVHLISLLPQLEGLIVPSKFYGILAAGRPAIMIGDTDGEVARVIKQHNCGAVVASGDWDMLVSAIWRMKENARLGAVSGVVARNVFEANYSYKICCSKWARTICSVVGIGVPSEASIDQIAALSPKLITKVPV